MKVHIEILRVDSKNLSGNHLGESSADIRACVESARAQQRLRFAKAVNVTDAIQLCKLNEAGESLLRAR